MSVYHVLIYPEVPGDLSPPVELFRTEDFPAARTVADDHKANTGFNCYIESHTVVYTTQTLEEAMEQFRSRPAHPLGYPDGVPRR